jgi:hypothetical protein
MGSDETATATTGGPRVIDVFDGNGAPSGPNCLLFSDVYRLVDSLWDRSGVGWSPAPHATVLGAPQRALDPKLVGLVVQPDSWLGTCTDVPIDGSARACAVGDCTCIVPTLGDPRETSGPRIDRIPSTRPPWWLRQYRELKKLFFLPPSKRPIDLFGPLANRTILKRLHGAYSFCLLVSYRPLALVLAGAHAGDNRCPAVKRLALLRLSGLSQPTHHCATPGRPSRR